MESPNPEGLSRLPWAQIWPRLPLSGSGCFLSRRLASRWVVWAGGLSHETPVPQLRLSSPHAAFICSFMVAAPIFGYLGDRFNRRVILSCGIFFWSAVTFSSSFIPQQVRSARAFHPAFLLILSVCPGSSSGWQV